MIVEIAALLVADGDPPRSIATDLAGVDYALLDPVVHEMNTHAELVGQLSDRDFVRPL